jgi:hypothetical protein
MTSEFRIELEHEGAYLNSYNPTADRLVRKIHRFEPRPRRKLHFDLWEMEPEAGEDERIDIDLGLDQIENMD